MFHVSNLEKCYANEPLAVPLDGLHINDKLYFVEEPVVIIDRDIKRLKQSRIPIVKVRWNSRQGPEFNQGTQGSISKENIHISLTKRPAPLSSVEVNKARASDEELEEPIKDQPLPADASPTALSPGYIANSEPEEDEEDPEEDPADYPADGGDNYDNESSDDDDDDDDVEKDEKDKEEEEHLALADPFVVPTDDFVPSS
ncbi:hypothetical protein Tco_0319693 [Tanacetum coccineum]